MRWVNAAIIVVVIFILVHSPWTCQTSIQTPIDTMQVAKYKAEIDS